MIRNWLWRRRVRRARQLIEARRFHRYTKTAPQTPGGWIALPESVRMQDVVFWFQRERGH